MDTVRVLFDVKAAAHLAIAEDGNTAAPTRPVSVAMGWIRHYEAQQLVIFSFS